MQMYFPICLCACSSVSREDGVTFSWKTRISNSVSFWIVSHESHIECQNEFIYAMWPIVMNQKLSIQMRLQTRISVFPSVKSLQHFFQKSHLFYSLIAWTINYGWGAFVRNFEMAIFFEYVSVCVYCLPIV